MAERVKDLDTSLATQALANMRERISLMEDEPGRFGVEYVNDLIAGANALQAEMLLTDLLVGKVADLRREALGPRGLQPLDPEVRERLFSDEEIGKFRDEAEKDAQFVPPPYDLEQRVNNLEAWQGTVQDTLGVMERNLDLVSRNQRIPSIANQVEEEMSEDLPEEEPEQI